MADIETEILSKSVIKPLIWKRYIDDIFSLWDVSKQDIDKFITQANSHHPTIKFTAEISNTEATFVDIVVYKGKHFHGFAVSFSFCREVFYFAVSFLFCRELYGFAVSILVLP